MAHTHHPHPHHFHHVHLLSHEWFELHTKWLARLKGSGFTLGTAALAAIAAVQMGKLELVLSVPTAVDVAADATHVPAATTSYFTDQFFEQKKQAEIEELPPQF
jgi:hypothetical protein